MKRIINFLNLKYGRDISPKCLQRHTVGCFFFLDSLLGASFSFFDSLLGALKVSKDTISNANSKIIKTLEHCY